MKPTKINLPSDQQENMEVSVPLYEDELVVRPELNTAKFADFIFPPSHAKNLKKTRTKQWKGALPNGKEGDIYLRVSPPESFKAPSHNTYKVLLALYDLWQNHHLADGTCICSVRDILQRLKLSASGQNAKMIEREIDALRETIIAWDFSFKDETGEGKQLRRMNIVSKFEYQSIVKPNKQFTSRVEFRFDNNIQRNLEINRTRPYQLGELCSIKGEIASVLYTRLDIIMANRVKPYERISKNLFADLGLDSDKYKYPSRRKYKLEAVIKQLNGKRISTGERLLLKIERTAEDNDWKLVVEKISPASLVRPLTPSLPIINDKDTIVYLGEKIGAALGNYESHRQLYERLATHYSLQLLLQALSEFQADGGLEARSPGKFFIAIVHRLAHQKGKEWIKNCGPQCKYRQLSLL